MDQYTEILMRHYKRYPNIEVKDFLKMIYQSTYGVRHFALPSVERLRHYLLEELETRQYYRETPLVEAIGNDYVRVSLEAVKKEIITVSQLVSMFMATLKRPLESEALLAHSFQTKTMKLVTLIEDGHILFSLESARNELEEYLRQGIHATHHSEVYRACYHPHYRVIHKDDLTNKLDEVIR